MYYYNTLFFYVLQYILFIISAGLGAWSDFSFLSLANHMPDQQIQNLNLTASVIHFIIDHVWIFHQDNDPK